MLTDWLIAIGTLLAVLAALFIAVFQDWLRSIYSRPNLKVTVSLFPPYCHKTIANISSPPITKKSRKKIYGERIQADCYYFRLRIRNTGNVRAENVEVYAVELTKQTANGSFQLVESFLPMNFVWSHNHAVYIPAISPKMEKLCDLGHIIDPQKRGKFLYDNNPLLDVPTGQITFSFDLEVIATILSHIIGPGKYRLKIIVGSANSKPNEKVLEINLPGKWYDDEKKMITEGISISII